MSGCFTKPTSLDNPILFTKSVASSLALIALCLFLRHLQDCGYSTKYRTRDLESGELPTKDSSKRKGLGFGCIEKTSSNAKLKYGRAELRMEPGKNFDDWDIVFSIVKSHLEGAKRPTENFF
jgi:hypothetical protein